MRPSLALAATVALLAAGLGLAAPADAACSVGDTTCTGVVFTVSGGLISLAAPAAASAATATPSSTGGTVDISIGATVVTDGRIPTTGWSVTATASDFDAGGGATIAKANAAFSIPSAPTSVTGCSSFPTRRTTPLSVNASTGTTPSAILTCNALTVNAATYVPVLTVTVPSGAVAGVYTGTVTQSVS